MRQLHPRAPKSYFIKPSNFFGQKVPPGGGKPQLHSNEIDIDNKVAEERHDHYYAKHPPRPHWKKPPPARYIGISCHVNFIGRLGSNGFQLK